MSGDLLSVSAALNRILENTSLLAEEHLSLELAFGRTLSRELAARRTQPPVDVAAMDGYALSTDDLPNPNGFRLIGESAAGRAYPKALQHGEIVRIFTGAPVPPGADAVLMQENARIDESGAIHPTSSVLIGENIRSKGIDFSEGCTALLAGRRLGAAELMLAAAMNHATLPVARQPKIAIMASGDELTLPGKEPGPSQIIACNSYAVSALARMAGANVIDLGVFCDNLEDLEIGIERAKELKADVLVTIGGASVGDHDLLRPALANKGMTLDFWRIAMRPGKPLIHGALGDMRILGLPGNPVASYVCSLVFLMPLIRALQGDPEAAADQTEPAIAGTNLSSNKARRDYMRASLSRNEAGALVATPHPRQDSSLITELAQSQALIVREAGANAVAAGAPCQIWRLPM